MDLWDWIGDKYSAVVESGDPRTNQWPLVRSPLFPVCFVVVYVATSILGPVVFKPKSPLPIRPLMVAFNVTVVITFCYIFQELLMSAYLANYSLICEPLDVSDNPLALRMASAFWLIYVIRFPVALDTVFYVLRKKGHEIPLRLVFHHSSIPIATWVGVKYAPGGQGFLHGLFSCIVHIVVYSYSAALCYPSTRKPVTWMKAFIPVMHVTQLSIVICHSLLGVYKGCFIPNWPLIGIAGYCFFLILNHLFLGQTVLLLDVMDTYWPRWLYGSRIITQMKKRQQKKGSHGGA